MTTWLRMDKEWRSVEQPAAGDLQVYSTFTGNLETVRTRMGMKSNEVSASITGGLLRLLWLLLLLLLLFGEEVLVSRL